MASITKRGSTWQYCVSRIVDGRYKPIRKGGFRTKKEASVAAAQIEADIAQGLIYIKKDISFARYFLEWFRTYKMDVGTITLNSYQATYNKILSYFNETPIQKVTKRDYQIFLNGLGEINAKDTNRKLNGYIRTCIKEAIEEGLIKNDFTRNVTISGTSGKKSSNKYLDYTSSQLLLQDLHKNIERGIENIMLILALSTGLRYGELIGLCINDLDFKNNRIRVLRQWKYKEGGGFGSLKTEKSERTVSIDKMTMLALKKHLITVKDNPANVHNLVFFEPASDISVISNDRLNNALRSILKRLNIKPLITVHGLRHTHSSILLYKGVSILYVSERLGHSNIDITTSTYAHVLKELRERDSKQANDIFEHLLIV
ncbi:tyrosine-type recombinase/integrase [Sporosarcina highlanderae]|uniref:Tyrosine-type recombinase/integrase n=1 Tax=Sporosarcina highlanderae TaxID=3035916 RepID=A0ABT8JPV6_9BACL|nr:tyrosine-type recombinase/integrase [Sporosarcina highlanderae]MDN4607180.1 tyrosine-type recombinase/integrase [Sporosarcina highlanderae]